MANNCLCNNSTPTQCMLGTLITFFLIHSLNESKHWASSIKLFTQLTCWHPRQRCLFLWIHLVTMEGVDAHQHVLQNFSVTLTAITNTANVLTNLKKSVDCLVKVTLDNHLALDHLLAEQGGVCTIANTSCCTYINISF